MRLPAELAATPLSFFLWGTSRRATNVLAHALAGVVDREFLWLSIRPGDDRRTEDEDWQARLLPAHRHLPSVAPADLTPDDAGSNLAAWTMRRAENTAGGPGLAGLLDFLRLPPGLRSVAEELDRERGTRCLTVANTDRIRALYPTDADGLRPFCRALTGRGVALIVTSVPPANPARFAFDVVMRIENYPDGAWRTGRVIVEQGLPHPPLRAGAVIDLAELPDYRASAESIDRALRDDRGGPAPSGAGEVSDPPGTPSRRDRGR